MGLNRRGRGRQGGELICAGGPRRAGRGGGRGWGEAGRNASAKRARAPTAVHMASAVPELFCAGRRGRRREVQQRSVGRDLTLGARASLPALSAEGANRKSRHHSSVECGRLFFFALTRSWRAGMPALPASWRARLTTAVRIADGGVGRRGDVRASYSSRLVS